MRTELHRSWSGRASDLPPHYFSSIYCDRPRLLKLRPAIWTGKLDCNRTGPEIKHIQTNDNGGSVMTNRNFKHLFRQPVSVGHTDRGRC
jgi:hypothetical protein